MKKIVVFILSLLSLVVTAQDNQETRTRTAAKVLYDMYSQDSIIAVQEQQDSINKLRIKSFQTELDSCMYVSNNCTMTLKKQVMVNKSSYKRGFWKGIWIGNITGMGIVIIISLL